MRTAASRRTGLVLVMTLVLAPWVRVSAAGDFDDGRRTLRLLPMNLGRNVVGLFSGDNLRPFVVGAGAAGVASIGDGEVGQPDPGNGFGKALETAGGWPSAVVVVGLFGAGRIADDSRFRAMSYDLLCAVIVDAGYTTLLKTIVVRERPDGSNDSSFPSGHSANAFTLATVADRHYGWRIGVPAYALAAVVGVSRVVRDRHYLSDVVAGAALGYIVGRTTVRVNGGSHRSPAGDALRVEPMVGRRGRGVRLTLSF